MKIKYHLLDTLQLLQHLYCIFHRNLWDESWKQIQMDHVNKILPGIKKLINVSSACMYKRFIILRQPDSTIVVSLTWWIFGRPLEPLRSTLSSTSSFIISWRNNSENHEIWKPCYIYLSLRKYGTQMRRSTVMTQNKSIIVIDFNSLYQMQIVFCEIHPPKASSSD